MSKNSRQTKLLEIIAKYDIDTQEELVSKLQAEGFKVTQATISRDIKDLNLIKTLSMDGNRYRYSVQKAEEPKTANRYLGLFKNTVNSLHYAGNLIVLKTLSGGAGPAAEFLDNLKIDNVMGIIAGDNTIFVAVDDVNATEKVANRIKSLLNVDSL